MSWWRAISPIPPPGPLRILAWATLTNTVGMGLWLAGSALFLTRSLGLSTRSVGVGLTVAALVGLIASVPFGRLADRRDPRTLRAVLQLLQAVVAASYLLVDSVASFIVVAVFSALLATGNLAVRAALVAAVGGAAGRVPAFAILRAVANLGTGVGAALAELALVADARAAYQLLVLGNAAAFALSAMLIMRLPPFPPGSVPAAPKRGLGPALRDAPFVAVGATSAVLSLHSVVLTLIIPLWVTSHTAAPTIMVAAVLVTNTVLTVLLAVRLSRGAQTATPAARTMRRAGLRPGHTGVRRRVPGRCRAPQRPRRCGGARSADPADPRRGPPRLGCAGAAVRGHRPVHPTADPMGGVDPPPTRTDAGAPSRSGWRRFGQLGWTPNRLRLRAAVQCMNSQLKNGKSARPATTGS